MIDIDTGARHLSTEIRGVLDVIFQQHSVQRVVAIASFIGHVVSDVAGIVVNPPLVESSFNSVSLARHFTGRLSAFAASRDQSL